MLSPWPKPGEGDYIQVRYTRVERNGVVLNPMPIFEFEGNGDLSKRVHD